MSAGETSPAPLTSAQAFAVVARLVEVLGKALNAGRVVTAEFCYGKEPGPVEGGWETWHETGEVTVTICVRLPGK